MLRYDAIRQLTLQVILVGAMFHAPQAMGFDTGYHSDVTRAVLRAHGVGDTSTRIIQVENWLVDYYSSSPTSPAAVKSELVKLHFDNLFSSKEVSWYWGWLQHNTIKTARKATRDKDPHLLLSTIAISLHAVQDFYSHSNWVEAHPRSGSAYSHLTYLSGGLPKDIELVTGTYDFPASAPIGHPKHGGYGEGLNKDSQVRPKWDEAYVFSYCASWEWVALIKQEVDAVDANFWSKATQFTLTDGDMKKLKRDEEAVYRISLWIQTPGQDGHWKGNRSGWAAFFGTAAASFATGADSISVAQIKTKAVQNMLTPNLYQGGNPPSQPAAPKFNIPQKVIKVTVTNIKEMGDTTAFEPDIDVGNDADFYALVKVGNQVFIERVIQNAKDVGSPWQIMYFVDSATASVPVRIDVYDEDGAAAGDDDHCDIQPNTDRKHLALRVNVADGSLSGDASGLHDAASSAVTSRGKKPNSDRAQITFYVQSLSVSHH